MTPIPILLYHSVGHTRAPAYRRWCVEPSLFEGHLDAIADEGYECLTVSALSDALDAGEMPARPLLITFDDGRADFVEHAVPALDRRAMASTMYVVTGHVGGTSAWLDIPGEDGQPMMSWSDLEAITASGHEVGAHSRTHPELDVLAIDASVAEIVGSRRELEQGLGRPVRSFAYPHGYHSRKVVAATEAAGFDSACAVNDRWSWPGEARHARSRLIVDGGTTPEQLIGRLADPPAAPERSRPVRRAAWRAARWTRHRRPSRAA